MTTEHANFAVSRLIRGVVFTGLALLALIWGLLAADLRHEKEMHVEQAQANMENLAIAFDKHVESTLTGIDAVLISLRQELRGNVHLTNAVDMVEWALQGPLRDAIVQIGFIDKKGYLVYNSANTAVKPVFVGQSEHFLVHVEPGTDRLFVDQAIRLPGSGMDVIPFSRRVSAHDGSFLGVVTVLVRPQYFSNFYKSIELGPHGAVTLVRNGVVLARASAFAPRANPIGLDASNVLPGPNVGSETRELVSPVDGLKRLVHYRRVQGHPLAVIVSTTELDYLAEYRDTLLSHSAYAFVTSIALLLMAWFLITLARRLDQSMRLASANEVRYRSLFQSAPVAYQSLDGEGRILDVNTQWVQLFGWDADEVFGQHLSKFFSPDALAHLPCLQPALGELARAASPPAAFEIKRKNGERRMVTLEGCGRDSVIGAPDSIQCVFRDVTDELAVAGELANQHALLRRLIDCIPDLIFFKDVNGVYLGGNKAFAEFAGRGQKAPIGLTDQVVFGPETAQHFLAKDQEMFASGKSLHHEEWVLYPDRREVLLDTLRAPLLDAQGGLLGLIGISRDITRRKSAEEGLLLAQSVFESTNEAIMVTDTAARILMVNPAFVAITGWSAEDAIGRRPNLLRSGRHPLAFYEEMWAALLENGHWEGEICNRRKGGELYVEWMSINAIRDPDGEVSRYVALFSDITARKNHETEVWRQANFDALTGLANRNLFHDRLERAMVSGRRNQQQVGLMFIDLDRFKWINDTLGHEVGDTLLIEAAKRLQGCVRDEDTVARMGGDEFTVVLQGLADQEALQDVAMKILASLAQPFSLAGGPQSISGSVGVAIFPTDADNSSDLLRNADIAMYQAKAAGRNRYQFYSADMQEEALQRVAMERDLRRAINGDELVLHYQPIVSMEGHLLVGAEALLRWQHPERGLLPPSEFLSVAEDSHLIVSLGEWVIDRVCRQWRAWVDAGLAPVRISINVSNVHFRDSGLGPWVAGALARYAVPGRMVSLELNESAMLAAGHTPSPLVSDLAALGLHYSLDDFGTGYSSLAALKWLPFETVKIDRGFMPALLTSADDQRMVEAMISMAHSLNLKVVAEGVETVAQQQFLRDLGCDFVQGYLIGTGVPAKDFEPYLVLKTAKDIQFEKSEVSLL